MKIAGFNFTKIHAEKSTKPAQKVNINTNIDISDINELKSDYINSKEKIIGVKFSYKIEYNPEFANISFEGIVLFALDPKEAQDVLKQWEGKKILESFKIPLFNTILKKANLRALHLEEELNLPQHIPMPSVKAGDKE
jgi:hypothetical protein